jgi:hypothetical protein
VGAGGGYGAHPSVFGPAYQNVDPVYVHGAHRVRFELALFENDSKLIDRFAFFFVRPTDGGADSTSSQWCKMYLSPVSQHASRSLSADGCDSGQDRVRDNL